MNSLGGLILCGGQSTRMGRPKCWLPFGGEPLLLRVVRLLSQAVGPVVVVAAKNQAVPTLPAGLRLVHDEAPDGGPLQGLAAGLTALQGEVEAVYLTGCDTPFLRPALVGRLAELLGSHSICVPQVAGQPQPLAALYRVEVLPIVGQLLQEGRPGPIRLLKRVPTRLVEPAELESVDPTLQTLRNLNTPADYEAALAELPGEKGVPAP